jgi:hypothetical protein
LSNHQKQIRVPGLLAGRGDHGVSLAAVMGLMVEEVRHQQAARLAQLFVDGRAEPDLLLRQPLLADALCPA